MGFMRIPPINKSFAIFNLFIDNVSVFIKSTLPLKIALLSTLILLAFIEVTSNLSETVIYLDFISLFTNILLNI